MVRKQWHSASEEETKAAAETLAALLKPGDLIALSGDLGAGKTTFTKALGAAFGVTELINSPTFTIMKEYEGRHPFYHMDAYRLEDSMEELGLDDYLEHGVLLVEWPEMIDDILPKERLQVTIRYDGPSERTMTAEAFGSRAGQLLEDWI
ncbi:tRNA (adenosine(37)-N6)-threonylcarbamoyltransferase complex ATPase subunit type 1 TsaE [Alkalicoccus luteus]|uniref:tRNA threonylcarbamoyladenosine biosynthesis protein TsaE n=1 Tax=Alkalicoccus luteus TaxID=1237094 RepID=A0A969PT89_9BACI|nr:tRNA (adenosine(37)-N6)-threonylcarbamoyltransferase complex ATPase subunit type 1 TsaE [Alkalicoccus luteus]